MAPQTEEDDEYCCGGFNPDDIVITGIGGRFPESDNLSELSEGLYAGKEFVLPSDKRWEKGSMGIKFSQAGHIKDISKFDADFFGIAASNANDSDPMQRLLLQVSYEAIVDAGYDPQTLRGAKIGVYSSVSEMEGKEIRQKETQRTKNAAGYLRCMNANRCSYYFNFHGPSVCLDTACSSSAVALNFAVNDVKEGRCEAALVTGAQLLLSPEGTSFYQGTAIGTNTGQSAPFDANTSGMIRSEATVALFIQKASRARRVYGTIANIKIHTAGFVTEGIYVPSLESQTYLFEETFKEIGLDNSVVDYIECHGTGTVVGDPIELNAVAKVFCKGRTKPLYVGTVKSNIGHTEPAAGICGIIKALLAFETGMIAPNINYENPNTACPALVKGDLIVPLKPIPLTSSYIPVNSFGFGGANAHIILKKNPLESIGEPTARKIPRIVLFPATTEEGVQYMFDYLHKTPLHDGFYSLLDNLSFTSTLYKQYRGYTIIKDAGEPITDVKHTFQKTSNVWYVMTGMGCQWPGMGLSLMKVDLFAESMRRSAEVIKPFGIDLFELLKADKNYLQQDRNITPAFVTITAIQIALIDILNALGIRPDGIVGHSTGELACAYADGCCTAEQTMLSAYWRGKAVESSNLPAGAMAAVGLTWEEAEKICPENVYPACHNADDSITISGLKEPLEKFVEELKSKNIFARIVNAYGYAFHCNLIWPAADALRSVLQKIITDPKPRTERWLSSSYLESEWEEPNCKLATSEYFVHNLMSNVRFNEVLKKIPTNATVIEIGPHFLLRSILTRAIGPDASYIGLMKRNQDNVDFLLESIGKLYTLGLDPKVQKLYPPAKYPVPRSTPTISDLIKWNHSISWRVVKWQTFNSGSIKIVVKPDSTDAYLLDHCIEGRSLFPATGYLCLAWEALAIRRNKNIKEMAITVENFKIYHAVILNFSEHTSFYVAFLNATGDFEIVESNSLVASGRITFTTKRILPKPPPAKARKNVPVMTGEDIYNELKIYGYDYGRAFQGLLELDVEGNDGVVAWNDRWIPYLDSLLLFFGMVDNCHIFPLPTGIQSIKIDPFALREVLEERESKGLSGLPVSYDHDTKRCISAGVEINRLKVEPAPHRHSSDNAPMLEQYTFVPYSKSSAISDDEKKRCVQYMYACDEMVKKITSSSGDSRWNHVEFPSVMIKDFDLDDYVKNTSEEHGLLSALQKISLLRFNDQLAKERKEILQAYIESTKNDIMYNTLISEDIIRLALDVITENSSRKLSLLEVHKGLIPMSPIACKVMHSYSHKDFTKCTIVSDNPSSIGENTLAEFSIELANVQCLGDFTSDKKQDIVISSFHSGKYDEFYSHIKTLISVTKEGGFIILVSKSQMLPAEKFLYALCNEEILTHSEEELERIILQEDLSIVSKLSDCFGSSMYLLRNTSSKSYLTNKVLNIEEGNFERWVEDLKKALTQDTGDSERIWLLSEKSTTNGLIGLVNCLRQEPGGEKIRCVFISTKGAPDKLPPFSFKEPFYASVLKKDLLMNVYKNGQWGSFRHQRIHDAKKPQIVNDCYLNCARYGDLSSFQWFESSVEQQRSPEIEKSLIHIYYAPVNFKDIMLATGKLATVIADPSGDSDCVLGIEYSGKDSTGKRRMGYLYKKALATTCYASPYLTYDVPDHWTLEQASTVPVIYSTCYYALFVRGQLKRGESILIHSGTGGIGQAAIRIALSLDCEIYTTVGNDSKREYLKKLFPQIKDENIGCSRDISFEDLIMKRTSGCGVDVVLNSLADDKFHASIRCICKHGRFLEIGKYDLVKDNALGLAMFLQNLTFHAVCLDQYGTRLDIVKHQATLSEIQRHVNEGIESGVVQPLDATVFHRDEAEKAFRYMASGTHVGKVILKIRDEEPEKSAIPTPLKLPAIPITYFYKHKVYIIVGGLGGFGIELTKWMAKKGAHNIVLTSRYGARTPYHHLCLKRWKTQGLNIVVSTLNVAKEDEAKKLMIEVAAIGPIGGIFNSALVLRDGFIDNQTPKFFEEVCAPKATATKYLDKLSRSLCPSLDYFICFSSISCGKGNAGQSNYGYANSVMERICEQRVNDGLHGLAIQWGIIGDVGIVHRHVGEDARIAGVRAQSVKSCLETLDTFCRLKLPVVSSYVNADTVKVKENQGDVLTRLAIIFGLKNQSEFNVHRSLNEMGMDSMIGVEVKHLLETHCETTFSMQELNEMKIEDIKALVAKADTTKKQDKPTYTGMSSTSRITFPESFVPNISISQINSRIGGTPIFIVCMGDNEMSQISALAETMSNITFSVHWTKDTPMNDVPTMAKWLLKEITNTVGSFEIHLIGYKLGAPLAFEMAVQGETQVKSFSVLEGSMAFVKALDVQDSATCDENSNLIDFANQFIPGNMAKLKTELAGKENLEQKVSTVANALSKLSHQSINKNDLGDAIHAYMKRRSVIEKYVPSVCIDKNIAIVESTAQLLANEVSVVKSLFSKICSKKIIIHRIVGPDNLLLENESITKVVSVLESLFIEV